MSLDEPFYTDFLVIPNRPRRRVRHRRYSRQDRSWGGLAWTDPIPSKTRTYSPLGDLPREVWTRLGDAEPIGVDGLRHVRLIRPDWTGDWAETWHQLELA